MAHPLRPLSAAEIDDASALVHASGQLATGGDESKAFFGTASLLEPPKRDVATWADGDAPLPRRVRLAGMDNGGDGGFEADVDLASKSVALSRIPMTVSRSCSAASRPRPRAQVVDA